VDEGRGLVRQVEMTSANVHSRLAEALIQGDEQGYLPTRPRAIRRSGRRSNGAGSSRARRGALGRATRSLPRLQLPRPTSNGSSNPPKTSIVGSSRVNLF
jgi:hypothetical protein